MLAEIPPDSTALVDASASLILDDAVPQSFDLHDEPDSFELESAPLVDVRVPLVC